MSHVSIGLFMEGFSVLAPLAKVMAFPTSGSVFLARNEYNIECFELEIQAIFWPSRSHSLRPAISDSNHPLLIHLPPKALTLKYQNGY